MTIWNILLVAALAVSCVLSARLLIHYFQLEIYQFQGYFRTVKRNLLRSFLPGIVLNLVFIGAGILLVLIIPEDNLWLPGLLLSLCLLAAGALIHRSLKKAKQKKALVYTPRVKRLIAFMAITFTAILLVFVSLAGSSVKGTFSSRLFSALVLLFPAMLPLWTAVGGLVAWPVESGIKHLYLLDAKQRLEQRPDLIKLGITGSWGKTSVKFILGTLLQEKYNTLVTPASFNTPMGVTRVVRSQLAPAHHVFVAEIGARHVGEIKELCSLVHPSIGILTSVGPQHLDTFRTLDRIISTKYELMEAIPDDGLCCFADDRDICRTLYEKTEKEKVIAGLDASYDSVWAENIQTGPEGSTFDLCTGQTKISCRTRLLGTLNIRNIVLCASVCLKLGLTGDQIRRGIEKVKPVEHRLQLLDTTGRYTVIDDAFNSNIVGAEQAFQTLKEFPGRRIVVTPGMVELGSREEEMNVTFGGLMAGCCDLAILVGKKRSEAIRKGLEDAGFDSGRILVLNSLAEAGQWIAENAREGDTILFENDLPDNYNE